MTTARVLPRRLAPLLLGAGNIAYGVAGLLDRQRTVAYAHVPGPLVGWSVAFIALGALILLTMTSVEYLSSVAVIAVMLWLAWATFNVEAHISSPHVVTLRGPIFTTWTALMHFLLGPYRRDQ